MTIEERVAALGGRVSGRQAVELGRHPWMTRQFVETEGARTRLQRWIAAGRPAGPFETNVAAVGVRLFDLAASTVARLPAPVAWHASAFVVIAGLDRELAGLCVHFPRMATLSLADEAPRLVLVDPGLADGDLAATIAHEIAHSWVGPVKPRAAKTSSAEYRAIKAAAVEIANSPADEDRGVMATLARDEELAHLLAFQWGYRGAGADLARLRRCGSLQYVTRGLIA